MADAPMRLNGAKFRADKTGLVSVVEPWEVATLAECYTFTPDDRPFGLPIVDRTAEEYVVGTWTLYLTYEGQSGEGEVSFDDDGRLEVELDTSMSQDTIKSHPNFEALKTKYGWNTAKEQFAETLPDTGSQSGALGGSKRAKRNPLHGSDSFLSVGAIFRVTFSARNAPRNLLDGIGTVVETPEGWQHLGIIAPKGRNWLKLAPKLQRRGNAVRVELEHMLSGPWGWVRDVYGAQQLRAS